MSLVNIQGDYATVSFHEESKSLIVTATKQFIPATYFRELFDKELIRLIEEYGVQRIVFDKRSLKVFDQESMIWYHLNWKEKVKKLGIKSHAKLLPDNSVFRSSVEIGRNRIKEMSFGFDFDQYNIKYFESLEEALAV